MKMQTLNSIRPVPSATGIQNAIPKPGLQARSLTYILSSDGNYIKSENPTPTTSVTSNSGTISPSAAVVTASQLVSDNRYIVTLADNTSDLDIVQTAATGVSTSNTIPDNAQIIYQSPSSNDSQFVTQTVDSVSTDSLQNGNQIIECGDANVEPPYVDYTQAAMYTTVNANASYYQTGGTNSTPQASNSSTNLGSSQIVSHQGNTFLVQGGNLLPEVANSEIKEIQSSDHIQYNLGGVGVGGGERLPHFDVKSWQREVQWLIDNYETAEGVSLPRSTLYNHYLRHCQAQKMDPMNPASFGKLIRSVFLGLRTRRLGTRGNSKYHYYGIRIKSTSKLNQYTEDFNMAVRQSPMVQGKRLKTDNAGATSTNFSNNTANSYSVDHSSHAQFLGDSTVAMPKLDPIECNEENMLEGLTSQHMLQFQTLYREHCEAILDIVVNLQFSLIEALWQTFWRNSPMDQLQCDSDIESRLNREDLIKMCTMPEVQKFVRNADYKFYQALVEILIPDVLRPIPSSLTQAIRNFAKSLESWLRNSMGGCCSSMVETKVSCVSAFALTLRRYTSLNHLAQAARAVLQNTAQINQMLSDLNRVDFTHVQEQASWVCGCHDEVIQQIETDFKKTLRGQNSLEQWAIWLESVVNQVLKPFSDNENFPTIARDFLMKWSFYSSMVIRDLTLRSAASFGSFHLIRLLYDEYMFYLIEHKVASATGENPVAVMAQPAKPSSKPASCGLKSSAAKTGHAVVTQQRDIVQAAMENMGGVGLDGLLNSAGDVVDVDTVIDGEIDGEIDASSVAMLNAVVSNPGNAIKHDAKIIPSISTINSGCRVINGASILSKPSHFLNNNISPVVSHNNVSILPGKTRADHTPTKTIVVVPGNMININNMDLKKQQMQSQPSSVKRMRTQ